MATLTIRNVPDETKRRLRIRAARHGRSMEAELREIVERALEAPEPGYDLGEIIHRRFAAVGGFDMPDIPREPAREPPDFAE